MVSRREIGAFSVITNLRMELFEPAVIISAGLINPARCRAEEGSKAREQLLAPTQPVFIPSLGTPWMSHTFRHRSLLFAWKSSIVSINIKAVKTRYFNSREGIPLTPMCNVHCTINQGWSLDTIMSARLSHLEVLMAGSTCLPQQDTGSAGTAVHLWAAEYVETFHV